MQWRNIARLTDDAVWTFMFTNGRKTHSCSLSTCVCVRVSRCLRDRECVCRCVSVSEYVCVCMYLDVCEHACDYMYIIFSQLPDTSMYNLQLNSSRYRQIYLLYSNDIL